MLAWYLEWDRTQRQHWIATFSFPLFGGIHPKNIFATRIEDLRSEIDAFSDRPLRVLDFGCGSGRTLELLAPRVSAGLGIDRRAPANGAHGEITAHYPQIRFEYWEHTPETLRETVQAYQPDLVILSHVLEHIEKPVDYLRAFHPFPILVCLPSEESWLQALRKKLGLSTSSDSTHFREYTRDSVEREFAEAAYRPANLRFNSEGELVFVARAIDGKKE
jgi:SAM-dependent methyltransferase